MVAKPSDFAEVCLGVNQLRTAISELRALRDVTTGVRQHEIDGLIVQFESALIDCQAQRAKAEERATSLVKAGL